MDPHAFLDCLIEIKYFFDYHDMYDLPNSPLVKLLGNIGVCLSL